MQNTATAQHNLTFVYEERYANGQSDKYLINTPANANLLFLELSKDTIIDNLNIMMSAIQAAKNKKQTVKIVSIDSQFETTIPDFAAHTLLFLNANTPTVNLIKSKNVQENENCVSQVIYIADPQKNYAPLLLQVPTTAKKKIQKEVYIETKRVDKFIVEFEMEDDEDEDDFEVQDRAEDIALEYMGNFGYDPNVEIGHGVVSICEHGEGTIMPINIEGGENSFSLDFEDDNDNLGV